MPFPPGFDLSRGEIHFIEGLLEAAIAKFNEHPAQVVQFFLGEVSGKKLEDFQLGIIQRGSHGGDFLQS